MRNWTKVRSALAVAIRTGAPEGEIQDLRTELAAARLMHHIEEVAGQLGLHDRQLLAERLLTDENRGR